MLLKIVEFYMKSNLNTVPQSNPSSLMSLLAISSDVLSSVFTHLSMTVLSSAPGRKSQPMPSTFLMQMAKVNDILKGLLITHNAPWTTRSRVSSQVRIKAIRPLSLHHYVFYHQLFATSLRKYGVQKYITLGHFNVVQSLIMSLSDILPGI